MDPGSNTGKPSIDRASFRDPSGFVFYHEGRVYRAVSQTYKENLTLLMSSGLYESLAAKNMLIKHKEIVDKGEIEGIWETCLPAGTVRGIQGISTVIEPETIPFISYPYEWCFSQLKDAALLTLKIQKESLKHGMTLKDASAYNIQFIGSKPIFIDTLSFEKYEEGRPWAAYGQFCRHFLAPLALMAFKHQSLSVLSRSFLDGIPLDLANSLLPKRSLANSVVLTHIHLHSKFISTSSSNEKSKKTFATISKKKLLALTEHMETGIEKFSLKEKKSAWNDYDETHNYTNRGKEAKRRIISGWMQKIKPNTTWDLGCNTGEYAELASEHSNYVLAMDSDFFCAERLYKNISKKNSANILPLVVDLSNPSSGIGWNNRERKTLPERGRADLILALALIHHLRIGNNTPWELIADLFSNWGDHLIVEFIPKEDSQIQRMLNTREDIFPDLDLNSFKKAFSKKFELLETSTVDDSLRSICLFKRNTH